VTLMMGSFDRQMYDVEGLSCRKLFRGAQLAHREPNNMRFERNNSRDNSIGPLVVMRLPGYDVAVELRLCVNRH
jgi:hypothetical protein